MQVQFETLSQFLDMGGHSIYVWSVYLLAILFLTLNFILAFVKFRRIKQNLIKDKNQTEQTKVANNL